MLKAFVYTPSAPAHGKARKWVRNRNVHVVVVDESKGEFNTIRSKCIVQKKTIAEEVDSRYIGPKSAYGQAVKEAKDYLNKLKYDNPMLLLQDL